MATIKPRFPSNYEMCNLDCFNCPYDDCIQDGITDNEIASAKHRDEIAKIRHSSDDVLAHRKSVARYRKSEKGKATQNRYRKSTKGQEAIRRYEQSSRCKESKTKYAKSEKGKEAHKRYLASPKGQEMLKRKYERRKLKLALAKEGV